MIASISAGLREYLKAGMRSVPLTMKARMTSSLPAAAALFSTGPKVLTPSDGCRWQMPHDCANTWRPRSCVSLRLACCAWVAGAASTSSSVETPCFIGDFSMGLSGGLQAVLPDDRCGGRRGDEFEEDPGRVRLLRAGVDSGREHGHALELARQRPDVVDSGEMHQLADLLEADLGLAARDQVADEHARRGLLELALDLARDTELLEHAQHVDAARPSGIADRFRSEQRPLQCL